MLSVKFRNIVNWALGFSTWNLTHVFHNYKERHRKWCRMVHVFDWLIK